MTERRKRNLLPVWIFIVLAALSGIALFIADRACSPAAPWLCWTPAGFEVANKDEPAKPLFTPATSTRWHAYCGDICRAPSECYYYCCGGDGRIDRSGAVYAESASCNCFPNGLAQGGERSCQAGKIGEMLGTARAAEGGNVDSQLRLAAFFDEGGRDMAEAARWYLKAAEQGSRAAQFRIGEMYETGKGVATDCKAAMGWYEKAGAEEKPENPRGFQYDSPVDKARDRLADIYGKGLCGPVNAGEALRWLSMGQGSSPAGLDYARALKLGDLYMKGGEGLKKDPKEAISWYRKAAEVRHPDDARAEYELAMIYARGDVVEQDFLKACRWYAMATRDRRYQARNICDPIEPYLNPGDIDKIYPLIRDGVLPEE